jgi:hypothetical protein
MGYKNLINASLNRAFNAVKDLADDVIFVKRNTSEFDFNSGDLKTSQTTQVAIKTIIIANTKNSSTSAGHNAKRTDGNDRKT